MTLTPRSTAYIALLVALGSFGPLTMSIYTPVMPSVGHDLVSSPDSVKLTLTTYMLGFAVGQLFYGPLSDRYGRRPVLIGGLLFFTVTTFACSFASSIGDLIVLRILQGLFLGLGWQGMNDMDETQGVIFRFRGPEVVRLEPGPELG